MRDVTGCLARIWAIALTTIREALRNRVLAVLVVFAIGLMAFSLVLGELSLYENERVIKDLGLAGISGMGTIIALFLGVNLLSKELDKKTVYFIVPKPLERWEFVVGKFVGLAVTLALLVATMSVILAGFVLSQSGHVGVSLIRAELMVMFELWLLTAVALLFSSFSSPYLSAMLTASLWLIGRNTIELRSFATGKLAGTVASSLLHGVARVVPDFHIFYVSGAVLEGRGVVSIHESFVTWSYVGKAGLYALTYGALCLAAASLLFSRRDLT